MQITLDDLRRFTVARNFLIPTTLKRAVDRMGFVQADPIRAPARAQDLILRHRVENYRAGDLERHYQTLDIEEDFFVVYGFVTRSLHNLMHPRSTASTTDQDAALAWSAAERKAAQLLLEFVRQCGVAHPRTVDAHFNHGTVENNWGGSSNATTHRLDALHYRGLLRVARREKGIRLYALTHRVSDFLMAAPDLDLNESLPTGRRSHRSSRVSHDERLVANASSDPDEHVTQLDALVDIVVRIYAPLPGASLALYVRRLRYAAPQWRLELTAALQRAKQRLSHARVAGVDWYWSGNETAFSNGIVVQERRPANLASDTVRLLAPFDPLVHDRTRFELLWEWAYRFEAYTPVPKRKLGYYAMPLLWRDRVIGWGNLTVKNGELESEFGFVKSPPRERAFKRALEAELDRLRVFLGLES